MTTRRMHGRLRRFTKEVVSRTPLLWLIAVLLITWVGFSAALYIAERDVPGTAFVSFGYALYWGIAGFSTAGIADTPLSGLGQVIGGAWIVLGSIVFFGTIVATVTAYFMRPLQRPARRVIETIEVNLERLDDLTVEELELLKKTTDSLIVHMEKVKVAQERRELAEGKKRQQQAQHKIKQR